MKSSSLFHDYRRSSIIYNFISAGIGLLIGAIITVIIWRWQQSYLRKKEKQVIAEAFIAEISHINELVNDFLPKIDTRNIILSQIKECRDVYVANVGKIGLFSKSTAKSLVEYYNIIHPLVIEIQKSDLLIKESKVDEFIVTHLGLYVDVLENLRRET